MLRRYKTISIIYGGKGRKCALKLYEKIQEMHKNDRIPVKAHLLADTFLNSEAIIKRVKKIIKESDICVILLTFDPDNKTSVRPNVLVEIGMALALHKRKKCYTVSEYEDLPADFASDLKGALNLNQMPFDDDHLEETASDIVEQLKKEYHLRSNKDILHSDEYIYEYEKVLDGIGRKIYKLEYARQMDAILEFWLKNVRTFTYTEERIYYILERVTFFPLFTNNSTLRHFFRKLLRSIREEVPDLGDNESKPLIESRIMVTKVLEYIMLVQNIGKVPVSRDDGLQFQDIAETLDEFIRKSVSNPAGAGTTKKTSPEISVSWYLKLIAYDYAALARMKMALSPGLSPDEKCRQLIKAVESLNSVEDIIKSRSGVHRVTLKELWFGYTKFNLSRAFEQIYRCCEQDKTLSFNIHYGGEIIENQEDLIRFIKATCNDAILYRRRWIDQSSLNGVLGKILSYEYFIAKTNEYRLRNEIPGFVDDTPEQRASEIDSTIRFLEVYCETTGLGKLLSVKDSLVELRAKMDVQT